MNARQLWNASTVPNGPRQFLATVIVLQYFQRHYRHYRQHESRILHILANRQK